MNSQFPDETLQRIGRCGVIAVLVIDKAPSIVPLGKALLACGIDCIELTLRTPAAIEAIGLAREELPEMLIGAGTVLQPDQVDEVVAAGASFGVAPGLNAKVVTRAQERGLPFAPGVATPSDIEAAIELGCRELKFFPAEPAGGIGYLRSISAPYAHRGLQFIPLGGVNDINLGTYLRDPAVLAVGGSWIATKKMVADQNWSAVIDNATATRRIIAERKKS